MEAGVAVGLSGQLALERRLTTIANNVANAGTAGFRAEGIRFSSIVSRTAPFPTTFAADGAPHVDTRSGAMVKTGNAMDVAIQGDGYLAILTPDGTGYTRDGRMQMLPGGDLVSLNGYPVLDVSGSPLTVNPSAGPLRISRDGNLAQDGRRVGAIGLFAIDLTKGYSRLDNASLVPRAPAEPVEDFVRNGVVQGFVEQSNVNPILEMTRLISVSRAFEAVSSGIEKQDQVMRDAIQALGGKS